MLNIGRLGRSGGADYYLRVGSGTDDYYVGGREALGRWVGSGTAALRLDGIVGAQAFRSLLARVRRIGRPGRLIPGFDLTFRAPKSVSVLWGLGDSALAGEVLAAHETAVGAALGYVEAEVIRTRRGRGGMESVVTRGVVAAAFGHRTSRAGDPLVHSHVVIVNSVQAVDDGLWLTLDSRRLYRHAKTAGYVYQARLRAELTRRLGVEWQPVVNGCADIAGIPREVIAVFSRRRAAIREAMADRGDTSARAAQIATLATRPAKDHDVTAEQLRDDWATRAAALGLTPERLVGMVGRRQWKPPTPEELEQVAERLAGEEGLRG